MENNTKTHSRYKSPFLRLNVTDEGLKKIGLVQNRFDELYRLLHQEARVEKCRHLWLARQGLEESCFRYCRAIAEQHEIQED